MKIDKYILKFLTTFWFSSSFAIMGLNIFDGLWEVFDDCFWIFKQIILIINDIKKNKSLKKIISDFFAITEVIIIKEDKFTSKNIKFLSKLNLINIFLLFFLNYNNKIFFIWIYININNLINIIKTIF